MTNGAIHLKARDSAPAAPPSGYFVFYVQDGEYRYRKPDGTVVSVGGGGGSGTVTSVGLSAPSDLLSVSGSPVTSSGTLALAKPTDTPANRVYASPDGTAGAAAFRALLAADIPTLDAAKIGSGTLDAARLPTIGETKGGTNQTAYTTGDLLYASGTNTLAKRAIGTSGQVLTVTGGVPTWATPSAGGVSVALLSYTVAQNTAGQSISATTWTTITLNTEDVDADNIVTISSNQFTPIAGDYVLMAVTSAFPSTGTANVRMRLRNVTGSVTVDFGTQGRNLSTSNNHLVLLSVFTANGTDAYAVQIYGSLAVTVGSAMNVSGESEIYMQVSLQKVG